MTITDTPKVWIGCLAAYNEGTLHGEWVDATDADDLEEAAHRIIKASPAHFAEEWFIADYDNFPGGVVRQLGEYASFSTVAHVATALEQHGEPLAKWLEAQDYGFDLDTPHLGEQFQEHYRGEWDSEEAYAMEEVCGAGLGWAGVSAEDCELLSGYLDWESIARDLFQHGDLTFVDGHVFQDEV